MNVLLRYLTPQIAALNRVDRARGAALCHPRDRGVLSRDQGNIDAIGKEMDGENVGVAAWSALRYGLGHLKAISWLAAGAWSMSECR